MPDDPKHPLPATQEPADALDRWAERWLGIKAGASVATAPPVVEKGKAGRKIIDRMGQKFGMLTVIGGPEHGNAGSIGKPIPIIIWECRCDCGRLKWVVAGNLTHGRVRTCGYRGCRGENQRRLRDAKR